MRDADLSVALHGATIWRGKPLTGAASAPLQEILEAYRSRGAGLLADLTGPFALAIVDRRRSAALLAVDRMGIERLTYSLSDELLVFATSATDVVSHPDVNDTLRYQSIFDYLFMHMVPSPYTVFSTVKKLPPATCLEITADTSALSRYWQPDYRYASESDFDDLKAGLRTALSTGVRQSGLDEATGAFLSGGLDSSSVAGTLAAIGDGPAKTFTIGFGVEEYDESYYARVANRHFRCEAFEYEMTPSDVVDAIPLVAAAYDEPFGNSSAVPTYFCARLAADNGVTHLLAGDGGDELFGGNERYVRQKVFAVYGRIPASLRRRLIEPASRWISPESRIMPLRKLRSYVDQARIPLPERFESWNYVYREAGGKMLDPDFAAAIEPEATLQLMRDVWETAPCESLLDRMLWYDWHFTLADNDLRKVGTMTQLAGVRVSYPLLHQDVIDLSTRVPPAMKIKGSQLRDFFKRAMSDLLPREIIDKTKHGFGSPFGVWLKSDPLLGDAIYSLLTDLKSRRFVSAAFIDTLLEQHRSGHPSYFGYTIWDLAMLEAWLAKHVDGMRSSARTEHAAGQGFGQP